MNYVRVTEIHGSHTILDHCTAMSKSIKSILTDKEAGPVRDLFSTGPAETELGISEVMRPGRIGP